MGARSPKALVRKQVRKQVRKEFANQEQQIVEDQDQGRCEG
jgi:hypothetical protein